MKKILLGCLAFISISACQQKEKVDQLVIGNIYSFHQEDFQASAMAIKDGKIVAVGGQELQQKYSAKETLDFGSKNIYPPFHDAHAHYTGYALTLNNVNLLNVQSEDELIERVQAFHKTKNLSFIYGRGWDQEKFPDKKYPNNKRLSELFPDIPVMLARVDGHALLANKKALEIAGITANTEIPGGEIHVQNGEPTGILLDMALERVYEKALPETSIEMTAQAIIQAQDSMLSYGLAYITDAGSDYDNIKLIDSLRQTNELVLRMNMMIMGSKNNFQHTQDFLSMGSDQFRVRSVKYSIDGALGSRGACLLEPYSDRANWHGLLIHPLDSFPMALNYCLENDFQLCTHAIGDSGNRFVLEQYTEALEGKTDARWRVEHAQVLHENDLQYFDGKNIIPSVQPTHATSDMYWAEDRLGKERLSYAYAYKTLHEQAGIIPIGTDFPVEHINPFYSLYAGISRQDLQAFPEGGFLPKEKLSREECLKGMTLDAAYAAHMEKHWGSIEAGKLADFMVLEEDLLSISQDKIPYLRPQSVNLSVKLVNP